MNHSIHSADRGTHLKIVIVALVVVFLVTYVVPSFATLYTSMSAQLPAVTLYLIAIGTTAKGYVSVAYCDRMDLALASATLVVSRAGAAWRPGRAGLRPCRSGTAWA